MNPNKFLMLALVLFLIPKIRKKLFKTDYDRCYEQMEQQGVGVFMMCGGVVGGDAYTEYLSYQCIDCPYFVFKIKEKTDD